MAVTLDCPDPAGLAAFYKDALGLEMLYSDDNNAYVGNADGSGVKLGFQRVEGYQQPQWPTQSQPQQFHLDVTVADLDSGEKAMVRLGATVADDQPDANSWRVLIDPAGHPFCVTLGE